VQVQRIGHADRVIQHHLRLLTLSILKVCGGKKEQCLQVLNIRLVDVDLRPGSFGVHLARADSCLLTSEEVWHKAAGHGV
jgi:hypothetical protein